MKRSTAWLCCMILCAGCNTSVSDIVIRNGRIADGTGSAMVVKDLAITNGIITDIGTNLAVAGDREIDASGMIVAPGFIDAHSHSSRMLLQNLSHDNMVRQGITTSVTGNCGSSQWNLEKYFSSLEEDPPINNIGIHVGHNTVRWAVMKGVDREPTAEELSSMERRVASAMEMGALGFSTGLMYIPGAYSKIDEVVSLAKVAAKYGGIYATHMRSEGPGLWGALTEAIEIGRRAQIQVQVSHAKIAADKYWGQAGKYLDMVQRARDEGMTIYVDQYPYIAGGITIFAFLPEWSTVGGRDALLKRMQEPETKERLVQDTIEEWTRWAQTYNRAEKIFIVKLESEPTYTGKSLLEICEMLGREPTLENGVRLALELVEKEPCPIVVFFGNDSDVVQIMQNEYVMVGSDGSSVKIGNDVPHPRSYGAFPRVLGRYVREQGVLTFEEAVRKMTSLPAKAFGITDRGILEHGKIADIVIFDPETVIDNATFQEPHQFPTGIPYVIVSGEIVVDNNRITDRRPGKVIRGRGYRKAP